MTHFATLASDGSRQWKALCDSRHAWPALELAPSEGETYVKGTLPQERDITCPACRQKWQAGMKRVRRLFRHYRGEE